MKSQLCHSKAVPLVHLCRVLKLAVVSVLVMSVLLYDVALATDKVDKLESHERQKRNANTTQRPQYNELLTNMIREYSLDPSMIRYMPTTPSPENVNCYVEVPVTRRVGGRCVLLGSRTWGCQAGIFLAFSTECQNEAASNATTSLGEGTTAATRSRNPFRRRRRPNQP